MTQLLIQWANICSVLLLARPGARCWGSKGNRGYVFALELLPDWQWGSEPPPLRQGLAQVEGALGCRAEEGRWLGEGSRPASAEGLSCRESEWSCWGGVSQWWARERCVHVHGSLQGLTCSVRRAQGGMPGSGLKKLRGSSQGECVLKQVPGEGHNDSISSLEGVVAAAVQGTR